MTAKLISITSPVIEGLKTAEDVIVYKARVSNPDNQLNMLTGDKLLKYCINHGHWSPFEMASFCVELITSRAIAAQILRHRSFSFQEFSQRYSPVSTKPILAVGRKQSQKNRQSSVNELDSQAQNYWLKLQEEAYDLCYDAYDRAITYGVAREQARMLLPLATPTCMYMSGTVRSWIHYLQLRCQEDTQLEHRQVADEIKKIFIKQLPTISEALGW